MISDYRYEKVVKPILETFNEIELELITNIASQFKLSEEINDISRWQTNKLLSINGFDRTNIRSISKYSGKTQRQIKKALTTVGYEIINKPLYRKAYEKKKLIKEPTIVYENAQIRNIINEAINNTTNYTKLIKTAAITNSREKYISILNKAYLETASGVYDYKTSIKKALNRMADEGITVVKYAKRNGKTINYSIESAVRRDVLTKTRQTALATQMEVIKELGVDYVSVSSHLGARVDMHNPINNHAMWQGKIYKLNGENKRFKNFYTVTGYGEMLGLGGVNCRHSFQPYIWGVSPKPEKVPNKKNEKIYFLTQKQRGLEREVRKWKKRLAVSRSIGDTEESIFNQKKLKEKQGFLQNFINNHEELKREYDREYIQKI